MKMNIKYYVGFIPTFLSVMVMHAQTIMYSSGFETGDPTFTYNARTGSCAPSSTGARTGTYCGKIIETGTKSYDGSIVTNTALTFNPCTL